MRIGHFLVAAGTILISCGVAQAETCTSRANQCDQACAARPTVYPYTSPYDRCAASCQPRWQQCLRTGVWVHLEGRRPGWRERVERFF